VWREIYSDAELTAIKNLLKESQLSLRKELPKLQIKNQSWLSIGNPNVNNMLRVLSFGPESCLMGRLEEL